MTDEQRKWLAEKLGEVEDREAGLLAQDEVQNGPVSYHPGFGDDGFTPRTSGEGPVLGPRISPEDERMLRERFAGAGLTANSDRAQLAELNRHSVPVLTPFVDETTMPEPDRGGNPVGCLILIVVAFLIFAALGAGWVF